MWRAIAAVLCLVALVACSWGRTPATPSPTATATATVAPTATLPPTATATTPPTATPTPTPTDTPRPPTPTTTSTPTAAPTATPRAAATPTSPPDATVRDSTGLCQATLPGAFRDDGGIWRDGDAAGATLAGLATGGLLSFDTVTQLLVGNLGGQIADYQETGRTREANDRLRIAYTGKVLGVPGSGVIYQRQFGQTMCALVLFTANGQEAAYAPAFERAIASLAAVR